MDDGSDAMKQSLKKQKTAGEKAGRRGKVFMELKLMLVLICTMLTVGFLFEISLLLRALIKILDRIEEQLTKRNSRN